METREIYNGTPVGSPQIFTLSHGTHQQPWVIRCTRDGWACADQFLGKGDGIWCDSLLGTKWRYSLLNHWKTNLFILILLPKTQDFKWLLFRFQKSSFFWRVEVSKTANKQDPGMHCVFVLHLEQVSFHTQMTLLFENHTIDLLLVVPLEIVAQVDPVQSNVHVLMGI